MADKNYLHTAYSKSANGTDGFTTVYPNLNILTNSYDFSKGYVFNQAGTVWEVLEPDNTPTKIIKLDYVASAWNGFFQSPTSGNWKTVPDVGDTVTLSFYARGGGGRLYSTIDGITDSINTLTTEDWKLYTLSGIATKKVLNIAIYHHNSSVDKTPIYIHSVKFEKGSIATPWMLSSSEVTTADWPKYVGTYVDTNPVSSMDPSKYGWDEIKYRIYLDGIAVAGSKLLSAKVENLKPDTSYTIQVKQVSGEEESDFSDGVIFQTVSLSKLMYKNRRRKNGRT